MPTMNMIQALNDAHKVMMARDEDVVVFGEDVGFFPMPGENADQPVALPDLAFDRDFHRPRLGHRRFVADHLEPVGDPQLAGPVVAIESVVGHRSPATQPCSSFRVRHRVRKPTLGHENFRLVIEKKGPGVAPRPFRFAWFGPA